MSSQASNDPGPKKPTTPKATPDAPRMRAEEFGLKSGDRLGSYELLATLGKGGMGTVFRALHVRLKKEFALKVLSPRFARDQDAIRRFERETEALGRLEHVHLVRASDAGVENGVPYVVMELLDGANLADLTKQHGAWPIAEACEAVRQAALGLQHAFERGLVHRDIKPSNLWLTPSGVVKLLDLGLARLCGDESNAQPMTAAGMWVGTPDYVAPEQILDSHTADIRADLYSLGCTLFHLLTGEPPFGNSTHPTLRQKGEAHLKEPPPGIRQRRPDVPAELAGVLARLLAKQPEDRYQTPAEAATALKPFTENARLGGLLTQEWLTQPTVSSWDSETNRQGEQKLAASLTIGRRSCSLTLVSSVAAAVFVALPIGGWWYLHRHPNEPDTSAAKVSVEPPAVQVKKQGNPKEAANIKPLEAVQVEKMEVTHYATVNGARDLRRIRVLGKGVFSTHLNDSVTVDCRLSRPAYSFLIAFRPDGKPDVCFPEKDDEAPPLTDNPRYPSTSKGYNYGLEEGTGLHVFALVASSKPLPSFKEWWAKHPGCPWQRHEDAPPVVWRSNGIDDVEALTEDNPNGQRGKKKEVPGKTPVAELAKWLRSIPQVESVQVLGFAVLPNLEAEGPAKKAQMLKPPWQRMLQGEDVKKAAEQEKKLARLQEAGQFAEALKIAEALTELRAKVQGAEHWQAVDARFAVEAIRRVQKARKEEQQGYSRALVMQREAEALFDKGRYGEAQTLFEQVLAGFRKVLGEEHPFMAAGYSWLGYSLIVQAKYAGAEENLQKAVTLSRKLLGEEHPDTAKFYENMAGNWLEQSQFKKAEQGFRKVLAIKRKVLGEEDAETAASYDSLAQSLDGQGKYQEAEEDFRKALDIRIKVLGEENPDTAQSYNNLAAKLNDQAKYHEAEAGFRKALTIFRKVRGEEHPETAICYHNLAGNLQDQGKYKEADEDYRKALVIKRKLLGEEHPDTAKCLDNMAGNLEDQGKYKEAEERRLRALAIRLKVLQQENPEIAISYSNVATNQLKQGKYKKAEEGYRKALAMELKALGEEFAETAKSYNSLAYSLNLQGKYEEAEENYRKALAIKCKVLGEEHPDTATSYDNRAANLLAQSRFKQAEEDARKAVAIRRKVLGEEHAVTAKSSSNLAYILNAQGKYEEAEEHGLLAAKIFDKARLHIAASGLERATITTNQSPLPALAAVLARNGKPNDAWQRFEESLARGTWDDLSTRLRRPQAERDKQAQITTRIDRLSKLIERVNVAKPTPEQSKQREDLLSQLRQAYDGLAAFDRQLEHQYGPVAGQVFPRAQIQTELPTDAALLAWLDIPGQPKAADPNGEHWAILLRSTGDPIWVRLHGSGEKNTWTDADTKLPTRLRDALQKSYSEWKPLAERLRKQRLDPLAQHLKGVRRLIVLPSTALPGVPIELIADGYTVSYAHSGTMYAHLLRETVPSGKGLLVLADPVFDTPTEKQKPQPLPPGGVLLTMVLPGSNAAQAGLKPNDVLLRYGDTDLNKPADLKPQPESPDPQKTVPVIVWREGKKPSQPVSVNPGELGAIFAQEPAPQAVAEQRRWDRKLVSRSGADGDWPRLPGTRIEATSLHRLFDKDDPILLDSDASEQRLSELAQRGELGKYRYLHLATHGEVDDIFPLRSAVILSRDHLPDDKQRTEMLVSGQPIPDGRLEAEEALRRWNLHCDLVTLSACRTALGKYERGEGYVGFAQALILCGTRSVCLSLWKVDDTATALLMERFYQNLLGKRDGLKAPLPKAAALAEAKAWLRNLPRKEAVKRAASLSNGVDRGKRPEFQPLAVAPSAPAAEKSDCPFAHPYYWAAFVLVGHAE